MTKIGESAFSYCSALASIEIPNSVTWIGEGVFYDCYVLKSIVVAKESEHFKSVDNVLFSKDGKRLIAFTARSERNEYSIPKGVTEIGEGAFFRCSALKSIEIPNSVTEIGDGAFYDCSALTSVGIPDSVTVIREAAFSGCSALTSIEIPNSVKKIGDWAFFGCSALTSIEIPDSVTEIGYRAFAGCSSLKDLHVRWEHPEDMDFKNYVFEGINPDCILYVPIGAGYAYRHHEAFMGKFKEVRTER